LPNGVPNGVAVEQIIHHESDIAEVITMKKITDLIPKTHFTGVVK
jgi:hypothetical protein